MASNKQLSTPSTTMKTNNKAANKGILRSNPRYSTSSAKNGDVNPTLSTRNNSNTTTGPENSSSSSSSKSSSTRVVRSLADLVRSSAELSAEAAGITQNDVGRVISHKAVSAAAVGNHVDDGTTIRPDSSNSNNNTMSFDSDSIKEQEEKIMEGMGLSMLQISESGAPYLKTDGSTASSTSNAGPAVVDANGNPIAFGIVDEDGQHVKFCEYDNDNDGKENDENISSRERVQHRININRAGDENMFDDEEEEPTCEFNDTDSDNSDATGDDAILAELGLAELFPIDHDSDYEQEELHYSEEKRAFLIIWQTLSQWLTAETMDLIQGHDTDDDDEKRAQESSAAKSEDVSNTVEEVSVERRSVEIGASSRRSGITNMIRMHLTRSLAELKRLPLSTQQQKDILNDKRKIEQRLGECVRTFDISGPVANFSTKHWKVMTTILIIISFPSLSTDSGMLPSSAQSLGMTAEEYRYLTQSALTSLNDAT